MGLAIFSSQNIYAVTVKLGAFESIKLPLGLVLIFCAGLGAIIMTLFMGFAQKSIQFSFPSIPKFNTSSPRKSFQKSPTKPQKTSSNQRSANPNNKKEQESRDSFDDDWDDDWG
ncbi:hypothetical protein ABRG53_0848 [Pseudanabaena sp. ABRG5-3]|nr:hypothetical protein ABRG53_0848 [Pseudanabaena sp. ABRG5-3]